MHYSRRRMTPEELAASKERANLRRRLRRLWVSDCLFEELCDEVGMTADEVRAYAKTLGLDPHRPEPEVYLPTQEEILAETTMIKMSWTPAEWESRLGGRALGNIDDATGDDI
jgi:hypothetical protein